MKSGSVRVFGRSLHVLVKRDGKAWFNCAFSNNLMVVPPPLRRNGLLAWWLWGIKDISYLIVVFLRSPPLSMAIKWFPSLILGHEEGRGDSRWRKARGLGCSEDVVLGIHLPMFLISFFSVDEFLHKKINLRTNSGEGFVS